MMKMMTSRDDKATMTAMIGMSTDWLLSLGAGEEMVNQKRNPEVAV